MRVFDKVQWKLHRSFKKGENLNTSAVSKSQMAPCDCAVVSLFVVHTDSTQGTIREEWQCFWTKQWLYGRMLKCQSV